MASELTPTQLARKALIAIEVLETKLTYFQQEVANAELSKHRERTAVLENQVVQLNAQMQEHKLNRAEVEILGALKTRVTQLEDDKKRYQTWGFHVVIFFLGCISTIIIQIVLFLIKK